MNKKLEIRIVTTTKQNKDGYVEKEPVILGPNEYPNIYVDHEIDQEELNMALDTIITACMQKELHSINIDLDFKNRQQADVEPKELTMAELEMIVGCPIKIISSRGEN